MDEREKSASGTNLKSVTILGATGSIGVSTLDVLARHPDRYHVYALTANKQVDKLFEQCCAFHPKYAVMVDEAAAEQLTAKLRSAESDTEVLAGAAALERVAGSDETD